MISTSTFTKSSFVNRLNAISPAWKWAMGVFFVARVWFLIWPMLVSAMVPLVVQNVDLFGAPVLTAFDMSSSNRYVFSRRLDQEILFFRPGSPGTVADTQSGSTWSLQSGQSLAGQYRGRSLEHAEYTVEDVFPYHGVSADPNSTLAIWQRFDANWYLKIAEEGYSAADGSTVYFPLYPLLIRLAGRLLPGQYLLTAVLVSNLALLGALYFLYRIADSLIGAAGARRAIAYLLLFPTSFFFFAPYTESLFLCLSLAALYSADRGRWVLAGAVGGLAALTRLQGIALILPLAYFWWQSHGQTAFRDGVSGRAGTGRLVQVVAVLGDSRFLPLLLIPLGSVLFLGVTNLSLFASYESQLHARFVLPWDNLIASVELIGQGGATLADLLNLGFVLVFVGVCVLVWAKLPRGFGIYTFVMLLAPLFRMTTQQPLVSMTRYVLVLFPVFIIWAAWGSNRWFNRAVVYLSLPLNLYLSAQFFMWGWVA